MSRGTLWLLPNLLAEGAPLEDALPPKVSEIVPKLDGLICESERAGRRYLGRFDLGERKARDIPIAVVNGGSRRDEIAFALEPLEEGEQWGYLSDAGLPCVADPGGRLVHQARRLGMQVEALPGPSSILLALMLSGFPAQRFVYHHYIEKEPAARKRQLQAIERQARQSEEIHIWIEAPYRNDALLQQALELFHPESWFCVATNLMTPQQQVISHTVSHWSRELTLGKEPSVFLIWCPKTQQKKISIGKKHKRS